MVTTAAIYAPVSEAASQSSLLPLFRTAAAIGRGCAGLETPILSHDEQESFELADESPIVELAEALLDSKVRHPIVWVGYNDLFPLAIARVWTGMWPVARAAFSFGFAFMPQDVSHLEPPTVILSPLSKATRWPSPYRSLPLEQGEVKRGESVGVLLGLGDKIAARDRIVALQPITGKISDLAQLVRLDDLLRTTSLDVAAVRLMTRLATHFLDTTKFPDIAERIATSFSLSLRDASVDDILALRNVHLERLPAQAEVAGAVANWMVRNFEIAVQRRFDGVTELLSSPSTEGPFWSGINNGLRTSFSRSNWTRAMAATVWSLSLADLVVAERIFAVVPNGAPIERILVDSLPTGRISPELAKLLEAAAVKRRWGSLAAAALLASEQSTALERILHLDLTAQSRAKAVHYIAGALSRNGTLTDVLRANDNRVIADVVAAVRSDHSLLFGFDPKVAAWRSIWLLARSDADEPWLGIAMPLEVISESVFDLTLRNALSAEQARAFWSALVRTSAATIIDRPNRSDLWPLLSPPVRESIAAANAHEWWERALSGRVSHGRIEEPLQTALIAEAEKRVTVGPLLPPQEVRGHIRELLPALPVSVTNSWAPPPSSVTDAAAQLALLFARLGLPLFGLPFGASRMGKGHAEETSFRAQFPTDHVDQVNKASVVIVTALVKEQQALAAHLEGVHEEHHQLGDIYWIGDNPRGAGPVALVVAGQGNEKSARSTERALARFAPRIALFVGIAGGLKDVSIGDVVVAEKAYNYEFGKADKTFETRPDVTRAAFSIVQQAHAEIVSGEWLTLIDGADPSAARPRAYVGALASGSAVVSSTDSAHHGLIKRSYGDSLAVDMEAAGFLEACHSHPQVTAGVIRGISDLIDGKAGADSVGSQELAAKNAAAFTFALLRRLG